MMMMNTMPQEPCPPCPDCSTERLRIPCPDCHGYGGWWNALPPHPDDTDGENWGWQLCYTCAGAEWLTHCPNFYCPGKEWFGITVPGFKDFCSQE